MSFIYRKDIPNASGVVHIKKNKRGDLREIHCTSIDKIYKENDLKKIDFIKMDIEGMERNALEGAKEVIRKFKPKLSICTYHIPDDPIVLPKLIKEIRNDYIIEQKIGKLYAY